MKSQQASSNLPYNAPYGDVAASPLGKTTPIANAYDPSLLFSIPRQAKRDELNITATTLPFSGFDLWRAFEFSCLNLKGKPMVAILELLIPAESPNIVESKTLKLYLYSLANTKFASLEAVEAFLRKDLEAALQHRIMLRFIELNQPAAILRTPKVLKEMPIRSLPGICLDNQDLSCDVYTTKPELLQLAPNSEDSNANSATITETVYSNLLKSNCLITKQPDWASVQISYTGQKICHAGLLRYIVSFREHTEFHEQCIERIFTDIMQRCAPSKLTVIGFYTRRGGIDINPYRSNVRLEFPTKPWRTIRQ
jgi:7-cyano-7-deazaguanine reductase